MGEERVQTMVPSSHRASKAYLPMLATSGALPARPAGFAFEFKWDGVRALLYVVDREVRIQSRDGVDFTARYPEIVSAARSAVQTPVVLDGEIVALDDNNLPNFGRLQHRMHKERPPPTLVASVPATFFAFDLLERDGRPLVAKPFRERRAALEALALRGPHLFTPPINVGEGAATLEASRAMGLEGVVAKALESTYRPGSRSDQWIKIKNRNRQEFVIGGWTKGEGARGQTFGALLLGYYDPKGGLVYAGRVGTGFNDAVTILIERALKPLRRETSPFKGPTGPGRAVFVEPRLVADVEFANWSLDGVIRQSSFKGLRADKDPRTIIREPAAPTPR